MDNTIEVVDSLPALLVKMGLGTQRSRACVGAAVASLVAYAFKMPSCAFRKDGTLKPYAPVSFEPDATHAHFLLVPVVAAGICYYCT